MTQIHVIKLGGSLADSSLLKDWLELIALEGEGRTVVVPGGSRFADQVREFQQQWSFDDFKAHHMSVLAMQQMALLFQGIHSEMSLAGSPDEIKLLLKQRKVVIWSPEINILNNAGIPASWDVTSDSMAAWLANKLYATNLTLVKSAEIPQNYFVSELTEKGIVDNAFNQYANDLTYHIKVFNRNDIDLFSAWFINNG